MTVTEIGTAIGKDERTIRRWILKSKKLELVYKLEEAKNNKKAADYTLDEVIEIVEAGLGDIDAYIFKNFISMSPFERYKSIYELVALNMQKIDKRIDIVNSRIPL